MWPKATQSPSKSPLKTPMRKSSRPAKRTLLWASLYKYLFLPLIMNLESLYHRLDPSFHTQYKRDRVILRGEQPRIVPVEELVLQGNREKLRLVQIQGGDAINVGYSGDRDRLLETIDHLGIPTRWPENLGHKTFYLLKGQLQGKEPGPTHVSQIITGKENGLVLVLNQVIRCYESQAAANDTLSGGIRS